MSLKIISLKDKEDSDMNVKPVAMNEDHYSREDSSPFPYVIERLMAGVYLRREVFFTKKTPVGPSGRDFFIDEPEAFADGKLTPAARDKLIEATRRASGKVNRRMCAVFAKDEAVFCEPDGSYAESTDIPSGGLLFAGGPD